jgi:hypothetical protein
MAQSDCWSIRRHDRLGLLSALRRRSDFCALLDVAEPGEERGIYAIDIVDRERADRNTSPTPLCS